MAVSGRVQLTPALIFWKMEKPKNRENQFLYLNQVDENGDLIESKEDDISEENESSFEESPRQNTNSGGKDLAMIWTRIDNAAKGINYMSEELVATRDVFSQIRDLWDDFIENSEEDESEEDKDKTLDDIPFRQFSFCSTNDDDQTVFLGYGGEARLGDKEVEGPTPDPGVVQDVIEEGTGQEVSDDSEEADQAHSGWQTQKRRRRRYQEARRGDSREQRETGRMSRLPEGGHHVHGRHRPQPQVDPGPPLQDVVQCTRPLHHRDKGHDILQAEAGQVRYRYRGTPHIEAEPDEDQRGHLRAGRGQTHPGGHHGVPLQPSNRPEGEAQEDWLLELIKESFLDPSSSPPVDSYNCDFNYDFNYDYNPDFVIDISCLQLSHRVKGGRYEEYISSQVSNISDVLVINGMRGIPSKCDKCGEECSSKQELQAHKARAHPPPKATGTKPKTSSMKKAATSMMIGSPKTPQASGSNEVMDKWMRGETKSNEIARTISRSRQEATPRRDTPNPTSVSFAGGANNAILDESVSLLQDSEVDPASPYLNTLRMFPPNVIATPSGDGEGSWVISNAVEPEPEKPKRGREADDEDDREADKRTDDRPTPENRRPGARSLEPELARAELDTQEVMEVEFDSVEINTEEWTSATVQVVLPQSQTDSEPMSQASTQASSEQSQEVAAEQAPRYLRPSEMLSTSMNRWLHADTFSNIPEARALPPPASPGLAPTQFDSLELQESQVERHSRNEAIIRELRNNLEESESTRESSTG